MVTSEGCEIGPLHLTHPPLREEQQQQHCGSQPPSPTLNAEVVVMIFIVFEPTTSQSQGRHSTADLNVCFKEAVVIICRTTIFY